MRCATTHHFPIVRQSRDIGERGQSVNEIARLEMEMVPPASIGARAYDFNLAQRAHGSSRKGVGVLAASARIGVGGA
jgi:hypothetical protein